MGRDIPSFADGNIQADIFEMSNPLHFDDDHEPMLIEHLETKLKINAYKKTSSRRKRKRNRNSSKKNKKKSRSRRTQKI